LAHKADVNARNSDGETALMFAAQAGWPDIVQTLLDAGANPKAKNAFGRTALMLAAEEENNDIVRMLAGR
jgi:ankyrin repeat protein